MKYFRLSFLLFGLALLIVSCQKELSYEAGLGKGTLKKDVTGECLPVNVNGTYQKDTLLVATVNFVDIQISVSEPGSYSIKTDTINGYSFNGAGFFNVQGLNTVRLIGYGKPIVPGVDMFTVKFDTSVCQFNVTVTGTGGGGGSTYTFQCPSNPTFYGTYQTGVSTSGDSVRINVTSVAGGSYNITTSTTTSSNGVTFTGSGVLPASPSPQSVTLFASGTPTAAGPFTYTLTGTGNTSTCTFLQTYSPATTTNGIITFNIGTVNKTFNFSNIADTSFQPLPAPAPPGNYYIFSLSGFAAASPSQEAFALHLVKSPPYFSNGTTYTVNQFAQSIGLDAKYTDSTGVNYTAATDSTIQNPAFSVTINSISPTRVIGTFTGPLKNGSGTIITAMQGTFDLPLQ